MAPSAHPRSRGEHSSSKMTGTITCGSSPLARGTCHRCDTRRRSDRLIPARAGNIRPAQSPLHRAPAHPRSRGEHPTPNQPTPATSGSSPLARGTSLVQTKARLAGRLIPARAGNISRTVRIAGTRPAHPRSRGEHLEQMRVPATRGGSSPLARGTSLTNLQVAQELRLIPARAGNIP